MKFIDNKSTKAILRDCLKVVPFMKENNPNINLTTTRSLILNQFRKYKDVQDNKTIDSLRRNAIIGMSNYYVNSVKEEYLKNKDHYDKETELLKKEIGDN